MKADNVYRSRIKRFVEAAQSRGADAVLFYSTGWRREDARYMLGFQFTGPVNMILATADGKVRMGVSTESEQQKALSELPWLDEVVLEGPDMGRNIEAWKKAGLKEGIGVTRH